MRLPIPRHHIALDRDELRLGVGLAGRGRAPPGSRAAFEIAVARAFGAERAVAVESGRTALCLALQALDLAAGAVVVLPQYCFFSVVGVVEAMGLTPRFAPVDADTFTLDVVALAGALDGAACLVIVHPFGQAASVDRIAAICAEADVPLVEDASQSTGASLEGKSVGSFGAYGVFSLVSGKNLQTFGGGLVVAADPARAARLDVLTRGLQEADEDRARQLLRSSLPRWLLATRVGFAVAGWPGFVLIDALAPARLDQLFHEERRSFDPNERIRRLSDAQGALGLLGLERLDLRNSRRRHSAQRLLDGLGGVPGLALQHPDPRASHTWNAVPVRVADGDGLARRLLRAGVDVRKDYMDHYGAGRAFSEDVIYVPNHTAMTEADIDRVIAAVRAAIA